MPTDEEREKIRRGALRQAAAAICVFCDNQTLWSDAHEGDGLYEHWQIGDQGNKRACAATAIHRLIGTD